MFKHFYKKKTNFVTEYLHRKSTQRRLYREMGEGEEMKLKIKIGLSASLEKKCTSGTPKNQPRNLRDKGKTDGIRLIYIVYSNWVSASQRTRRVSITNKKC